MREREGEGDSKDSDSEKCSRKEVERRRSNSFEVSEKSSSKTLRGGAARVKQEGGAATRQGKKHGRKRASVAVGGNMQVRVFAGAADCSDSAAARQRKSLATAATATNPMGEGGNRSRASPRCSTTRSGGRGWPGRSDVTRWTRATEVGEDGDGNDTVQLRSIESS